MPSSQSSSQIGVFWNGEPCDARRVRVIVADDGRFPAYWARPFVGQERDAVEVVCAGQTFYIDDEGHEPGPEERETLEKFRLPTAKIGMPGYGWAKVTHGRGSPSIGHCDLAIERVVAERGGHRSLNEIAQDIIDRAPEVEPLVEEWFASTSAARIREWLAWEADHAA